MQIFDGCDAILKTDDPASLKAGFFVQLADTVHENWFKCDRSKPPSPQNWRFRVAEKVTFNPSTNYEKQLEKAIVTIFADEGWGNAVPTASGLVDSGNRQRNIDLVHRIPNGFEFIELKWKANNPVAAALQTSKYAALYLLFRLQPRLRESLHKF